MGPQDPKDVTRYTARGISGMVGELAALKRDTYHWLTSSQYDTLKHRPQDTHAAVKSLRRRLPGSNATRSSRA
jgi:hypothetical protein